MKTHPVAATIGLDMGFRLALPDKTVIRKPDLAGGVAEYYILHRDETRQAFYHCNEWGIYTPLDTPGGIVRSHVLPGFSFRVEDLSRRPATDHMIHDEVYRDFVFPAWRAAEQRAAVAEAEVARLKTLLDNPRRRGDA